MEICDAEKRKKFYKSLKINMNKCPRRQIFKTETINNYINICKTNFPKTPKDYYILNTYDVWYDEMKDENFLIYKKMKRRRNDAAAAVVSSSSSSSSISIFVGWENIYDFIKTAHHKCLHSGIKKTYTEVKKNAVNIRIKDVELFISLCYFCQHVKKKKKKNKFTIKSPIISKEFNQRVQIDLIDIKKLQYPDCSYIFNYQDNLTKFCILKPLVDKTAENVKTALIEIFNLFGAPKILHCDNGGEFRGKPLCEYFKLFWPNMIIIKGKPYNPRSQGSVERANGQIKNMLLAIMHNIENNNNNIMYNYDLKTALNYIQYVKNTSFNRTIKTTPYKALFGQDIVTEQNVQNIFKSWYGQNVEEEENNDSGGSDTNDNEEEQESTTIETRRQNITHVRNITATNIKLTAAAASSAVVVVPPPPLPS